MNIDLKADGDVGQMIDDNLQLRDMLKDIISDVNDVVKKAGDLYKYLIPAGESHKMASQTLKKLQGNGFPKVFISVYEGDERIKILYQ